VVAGDDSLGTPRGFPAGSNAYPSMAIRRLSVGSREIPTDGEGYLTHPSDWSEAAILILTDDRSAGPCLLRSSWVVMGTVYNRDLWACKLRQAPDRGWKPLPQARLGAFPASYLAK